MLTMDFNGTDHSQVGVATTVLPGLFAAGVEYFPETLAA